MARVVVVNFNGGDLVLACISSILGLRWNADLQVVVVDNASGDGSPQRISERFGSRVHVVARNTNDGFGAANVGMGSIPGLADPEWVGLVNPDATVDPDWLVALTNALAGDPRAGTATPLTLFADQFVTVDVRSPVHPIASDPRTLAVQLIDVRVADGGGTRRNLLARLGPGSEVYDVEGSGDTTFRWLGPGATLEVPVPAPTPDAPGNGPATLALTLVAPTPVSTEVTVGATTRRVALGAAPTTIEVTLTAAERARAADRVANAGTVVFTNGTGADRGHFAAVAGPWLEPAELFAFCGGGAVLRGSFLDDVGGFHQPLFLYYEDVDLAWRGARRGWRHLYVPAARMRHVQGASAGTGSTLHATLMTRNRLVVAVRNGSRSLVRNALAATSTEVRATLTAEVLTPLRHARRPVWSRLRLQLRALGGFARQLPGALWARRQLRRTARVSPAAVEAGLTPPPAGQGQPRPADT